jgi:hypothetical protein
MTVKTMRQSFRAKQFAALMLATFAFAVAANAQPRFVGKFTLPYEVHWNHAVLPAGEYSIRIDSRETPTVLHSASSNRSFFVAVPIIAKAENGGVHLLVTGRGQQHRVRTLNLPELGVSLVYDPLTTPELEMNANAGGMDTVPLITARK